MEQQSPPGERKGKDQIHGGVHHRQTEERLVLGGFAILLVVGGALTLLLLGREAAALAVGVVLVISGLLLAIYWGLGLVEMWLRGR